MNPVMVKKRIISAVELNRFSFKIPWKYKEAIKFLKNRREKCEGKKK